MIGTDGPPDSGKSEFILSCPPPGIVVALDRNYDGLIDNETPPPTRHPDFVWKTIDVPVATQYGSARDYQKYWQDFYTIYMRALANIHARTVGLDGDSDSYELQRLSEFGRVAKVPQIMYDNVNAARRAMVNRAHAANKIIVFTNKVKKAWEDEIDPLTGQPVLDEKTLKPKRRQSESLYERQGDPNQDYLWNIQLRHMYRKAHVTARGVNMPSQWGIKIMKCKVNKELEGYELWGSDCCFDSLVQTVYPNVDLKEWY